MNRYTKLTLFLFCFAIASLAQAQTDKAKVLWGDEEKAQKRSTLDGIVGYDNNGMYVLKRKMKPGSIVLSYSLDHYDKKFNKTNSVDLKMKANGRKLQLKSAMQWGDEIYLFNTYKDKRAKRNYLYATTVNKKTLQPNTDSKVIAEINYSGRNHNSGGFGLRMARDSSKLLIYKQLPYVKGGKEKIGFKVFDNEMNELWEKTVILPYSDKLFRVTSFKIDNNGNVHLLGKAYKGKLRETVNGVPNYKYRLLSYSNEGKTKKNNAITFGDLFIADMQFTFNKEEELICAGFYSKKGTYGIKGTFFIKYDMTDFSVLDKSHNEFEADFIVQNLSNWAKSKAKKKASKGKEPELYNYDLDNIILREDGGAVLIGEQYKVKTITHTTTTANGGTTTSTTTQYYYNDIIVVSLSPEGEIDWTKKIAKTQSSSNDGGFYSSYALAIVNDKLYFVFNDNVRNLDYNGNGRPVNYRLSGKSGVVVLIELDSEGRLSKREALFNTKELELIVRPKVCQQVSNNEMIIFGQKRKGHRFGKLTFDD